MDYWVRTAGCKQAKSKHIEYIDNATYSREQVRSVRFLFIVSFVVVWYIYIRSVVLVWFGVSSICVVRLFRLICILWPRWAATAALDRRVGQAGAFDWSC